MIPRLKDKHNPYIKNTFKIKFDLDTQTMLNNRSDDVDDIKKKIDEFLTMEENRNNS